ncbi:MAG: preprotein translocase subunit YajC [Gammaproteobacteria bacterium]|nr:preprotein translocase subunit YajC [Gammaproteobacteria bacterium]TVQ47428.1 MAG: preprotein translocase subunit YajC [Gammaproteobacteria bacterium]
MDFFLSPAHAAAGGGGDVFVGLLPLIIIFVLFYFLLIRPQMKRQKEHRQMVENLSTDDEIITAGGVLGRIIEVGEQFVTVEVADGVQLKVQRHTVGAIMPKGTYRSAS